MSQRVLKQRQYVIIDQKSAMSLLEPIRDDLRLCVRQGFDRYVQIVAPVLPLSHPGSNATFVHEFILQEIRSRFGSTTGMLIRERNARRRFMVYWQNALILQFKKLSQDMLTRNFPTETAKAMDAQEAEIPDCKPFPKLTIGYQLDEFGTGLAGVFVAFRIGNFCAWWYDLDTGEHTQELEFPSPDKLGPLVPDAPEKNQPQETSIGTDG